MKGLGPLQMQVEVALKEAADKYQTLESIEYDCVRRVLIEERSRFCYFISCLMPVLECQLHMFSEIGSLQELKDQITVLIENPHSLTQAAEDLIKSIIKPLSLSSADTMLAAALGCSSTPPASMDAGSSEGSLVSSRKSSVLSINSEASSSHSGGVNNNILSHRRSLSSSPSHALIEQESNEIFISDGRCEKLEYETTHYSQLDQPETSANNTNSNNNNNNTYNNTPTNCDVTNARDYDSVTLKRPKGTVGKGLHSEDDLVMFANLTWQPDTPNVNANYSALYQLHQPIPNQSNYPRKNSAGPLNGNMYPEYNTVHSCSPSSKPRRMTVPELPVSVQTYATLKHQARINVMHPPNIHLDQIDECRLPPNPNEDSNYSDDHDMPMPPPPSVDSDGPSGQLKGFVALTPLQNLTQQQHASQHHAQQQHALHQHVPPQHAPQQHASQKHATQQHASQQHASQQHLPQQHMPLQQMPLQQMPQQQMSQQQMSQQHMSQQHMSQQHIPQQQSSSMGQHASSYGATKPALHMNMPPVPPPPPCAPPPLFQTITGKSSPSIPPPPPLLSSQQHPQPTNTSHVNIPRPPCNAPVPPPPPPPPAPPAPPFFTMKRATKQ